MQENDGFKQRIKNLVINPPDFKIDWLMTGRGFLITPNMFPADVDPVLKKKYEGVNALGITEKEVEQWIKNQKPVLEVGPGEGNSTRQLKAKGVNIFALEPSLLSRSRRFDIKNARKKLSPLVKEGRVKACKAESVAHCFPGMKFDAIFAIGLNFQNFPHSEEGLVRQIKSLLSVLADNNESYLTFQLTDERGWIVYRDEQGYDDTFNLLKLLDLNKIRYSIVSFFDALADAHGFTIAPNREAFAVRIFKVNEDGEDATEAL